MAFDPPAHKPKFIFDLKKANIIDLRNFGTRKVPWSVLVPNAVTNISLSNWEELLWSELSISLYLKRNSEINLHPNGSTQKLKPYVVKRKKGKALRSKDPTVIEHFKALRRDCNKLIRPTYKRYLSNISSEISQNTKKFWDFFSAKRKSRKLPSALIVDESSTQYITDTLAHAKRFNH